MHTIVGNYTLMAWNVTIGPRVHRYQNFTCWDFVYENDDLSEEGSFGRYSCRIGSDVWIGCHVIVVPGCEVGDGAVIAAGSVVTHSVPPFAVVGGNPARFIKWRFPSDVIARLVKIRWWDWDREEVIRRKEELSLLVGFNLDSWKQARTERRSTLDVGSGKN